MSQDKQLPSRLSNPRPATLATTVSFTVATDAGWQDLIPKASHRVAWRRLAFPMALLLAIGLSLPSLEVGFYLDDYVMLNLIEGRYAFETPAINLYASFMDASSMWWKSPDAHFTFWRPLASALIHLNYLMFEHAAFYYHVQLLLVLAALIAVCARLYRDMSPAIAGTALLLFAADEAHALTSGTICNSHTLYSVIPALIGLDAYLRWREFAWQPGRVVSLLGFSVGLLSGETAIAVMAYALAYEIFAASGSVKRRLRAIAPLSMLAIAYVVCYKAAGLGPGQTGIYLNPFEQPFQEFLAALAIYLPLYTANLIGALPMDLASMPTVRGPYLLAGLLLPVVALFGWLKVRDHLARPNRKALQWLVPGAFASLLPVVLAPPAERQLLVPAIGIAPLLASFAVIAWQTFHQPLTSQKKRLMSVAALILVLGAHLGLASFNRVELQLEMIDLNAGLNANAASIASQVEIDTTGVVLINGDFLTSYYVAAILGQDLGQYGLQTLSNAPYPHQMTRVSDRTLVLELLEGQMLNTFTEKLLLTPGTILQEGDRIQTDLFVVEILKTSEQRPTEVAFHFVTSLDDETLVLLSQKESGIERVVAPPVGQSIAL